jgi:glycosyltransferase involved in cell wall biosynthesis
MSAVASVIVPVYNGARFLAEALQSVAAQDAQPLELLVVDDGSTDESVAIARAHGARVFRQERGGVARARNIAIAAATAPVLAFLDQDDVWHPAKLRLQIAALDRQPESVSLTQQNFFLEPPLTAPPAWFARPELIGVPHAGWAPSCTVFRREVFARVGPYDERLAQASDSDWIARAKELGIVFHVLDEVLVRRRIHGANDSASPTAFRELMQVARNAAARRRQNGSES